MRQWIRICLGPGVELSEVNAKVQTPNLLPNQHNCITPWALTRADNTCFKHLLHMGSHVLHHGSGNPSKSFFKKVCSSTTLISCFTRIVQSSSPDSKEKMAWYLANRWWVEVQFLSDHPSNPERSSF